MTSMTKRETRKEAAKRRDSLSQDQISLYSEQICGKLFRLPVFCSADTIYAYVSCRSEVRTEAILRKAWQQNKKVAVPRVEGEHIVFYEIRSFDDLLPGYYDIPEPVEGCIPSVLTDKTLVVMPGLAFDESRHRCGYGKGFYDSFLHTYPGHATCAISFETQIFEEIPADEMDVRPDCILTEKRILLPWDR